LQKALNIIILAINYVYVYEFTILRVPSGLAGIPRARAVTFSRNNIITTSKRKTTPPPHSHTTPGREFRVYYTRNTTRTQTHTLRYDTHTHSISGRRLWRRYLFYPPTAATYSSDIIFNSPLFMFIIFFFSRRVYVCNNY